MKKKSLLFLLLMTLLAPWAAAQKSLPYSYGFEDNDLSIDGWTTQNPSGLNASEFGINASAAKTGSYGFRFSSYNDSGTNTQYLISPELSAPKGVTVSFYYKCSSTYSSGETFKVGYSTTNTDVSSFSWSDEYSTSSKSWSQLPEFNCPAGTKYIAIYYYPNDQYRLYIDDISLNAPPSCMKPTGLAATLTPGDGTIATLNWTAGGEETAWVLEYGTTSDFTGATSVNVSGTPTKNLTGLTAETKYYARVKADCGGGDTSEWSDVISFTPTNAYTITVYDEEGTNSYIPMYGGYFDEFTKSECIIPATELSTIQWGQITSITFYAKSIGSNSSTWTSTNQKVFLKEVNFTTFGGSYSGMDGATIVFDGLLPMPTTSTDGYTITFSQPYTYSGGNLLIGVYNDDIGTYNSVTWYGKTGLTSGVSAYGNNSSSLASVGYTAQSFLPKTTFNYTPGSAPSCLPPTGLTATEDQPNQSVLSWTANNGETSWNIYYKKASAASYTEIADVTDNPYTLPNLDPATAYLYYVVANCTETSDPSAVFPFTTACGIISTYPWNENFDSYAGTTSGSTNNLPLCWNYINTSDGEYTSYKGYPIIYNGSSYSYSGNNHLRFYSYYSSWDDYDPQPEYAILPEMQNLSNKQIEFYARDYYGTSTFKVGIMTDPTDASSFTQIGESITPTSSYQKYIVSFENYTGAGTYIAFNMDAANSTTTTRSVCIDNLSVKPLPDCATPTGLAVTANSQTPEGATITWTAGEGTAWTVEYKKTADENWTAVTPNVTTPTYTFTGLDANTAYQARVSVVCSAGSGLTYPTDPVGFTTDVACPAPKNLVVSGITDTQAVLTWTPGYTETEWTVKYKKHADAEYTTVTPNVTTTPTVTLEGLTGATAYDVQIIGCEPTHIYTVNNAFSTVYGLPFMQDFEASTTSIPSGWSRYSGLMSEVLAGTAELTSVYGVWVFGNYQPIGNYCAQINIYGTARKHWLVTPVIMNNNNDNSLSFEMGRRLSTAGTCDDDIFAVLYSIDNGATWTILAKWDNAGSVYVYNDIPVGSTTDVYLALPATTKNKGVRFAFYGESQTGSNGNYYLCINDVAVDATPTCIRPSGLTSSNVTNHSATLTWTAGSNEQTAWEFKYNKGADFNPAEAGTLVENITANPYTFDKTLDAGTTYYFYVRGNCGGEPSAWSKKVCSFTTAAAAPAPTTFAKTEVGPDWVDLYWNAPAGDYLSGYGLYYAKTSTEPTAALVTIDNPTAPTSEAPYRLEGLDNETTYYIWVRANHGAEASTWKAITGSSFTTLVACPAPTALAANNITHTTADLTWTGYSDSYTVEYQTSAYNEVLFFEDFESGIPNTWTKHNEGDGPDWTTKTDNGNKVAISYSYLNSTNYDADNWLITPQVDLQGTLKITARDNSDSSYPDYFEVLLSTTGTDVADFTETLIDMFSPTTTYQEYSCDLSAYSGKGYIAIHHEASGAYYIAIDNVGIYGNEVPAGGWEVAPTTATSGAYTIEGLTAGTKYDVRVKGNCGGEYSDVKTFTTIDDNTKIFKTAGNWNVAGNWEGGIPNGDNDVLIRANARIPAGTAATAKNITIEGTPTPTLTIADGGTLMHRNSGVIATIEKNITGYGEGNDKWYLISTSLWNNILIANFSTQAQNLIATTESDYDLFHFSGTSEKEWRNYKLNNFNLYSGCGYLYANKNDVTLKFTEKLSPAYQGVDYANYTGSDPGTLSYDQTKPFGTFNLIGNSFPYPVLLYFEKGDVISHIEDFYVMNADGTEVVVSENDRLGVNQGAFIISTEENQYALLATYDLLASKAQRSSLNIRLSNDQNNIDFARIRFGEGYGLDKYQLNAEHTKLYIPQDGKDFAVTYKEAAEGVMPLNFKAETMGKYTISFKPENISFSYLRLVDNFTGANVDLLIDPEYTFIGSPRDDENRFRIVFSTNSAENENDVFVYQNGSDLIVNGEGELQIYDVMGRFVTGMKINGSERFSAEQYSNAVYIFRLVGSDVKTQKIVVR